MVKSLRYTSPGHPYFIEDDMEFDVYSSAIRLEADKGFHYPSYTVQPVMDRADAPSLIWQTDVTPEEGPKKLDTQCLLLWVF